MSTILQLNIPDKANLDPNDVSKFLAAKLYEAGKLTLAQGAQMVGMRTSDFADILSQYGVSLFNYPASDITKDALNA
jgi:predicted HTH domain antitoxin